MLYDIDVFGGWTLVVYFTFSFGGLVGIDRVRPVAGIQPSFSPTYHNFHDPISPQGSELVGKYKVILFICFYHYTKYGVVQLNFAVVLFTATHLPTFLEARKPDNS